MALDQMEKYPVQETVAVLCQAFSSSWPQLTKLSMCSNNSSQVITPGVLSGSTKSGH
eukprot:CAMPEP_0177465800 /NCGR_PEP_ID=MMETSP0369-20130122/17614_1 /TAXON_ID=447022 ORGANISM="Scrippsiella hangoei-like, Strain SHHI-4" /NCGR_SAMPLE_ID=MMETSP0369 /ASSEMBLY_ACC=CAM_ASM_000364 /LENGTH=56 /DNA_ID=CAMNT_0018939723 /DNA_START=165 /DNA_END=333 /DNA_ORIENTATION=-